MKGLVTLLLLAPISAAAEPVSIRTGEHDTFSRFVITIGVGTGWEVEPIEGGIVLNIDGRADGFDTSAVFDRIPRDRVTGVTQNSASQLFFALDCPCSADAFLWQPGQLVVDIVDGAEFLEPLPSQAISLAVTGTGPMLTAANTQQILPDLLALRQAGTAAILNPMPMAVQPVVKSEVPLADANENDVSATEMALIEGLSRAASQGFLDANVTDVQELDSPVDETVDEKPSPPPTDPVFPANPGIGITTALDRELALVGNAIERGITQTCLPADMFQFNDWADDTAFHSQVANLAEALAGEFGAEPREAQDNLARLYLHFGFGVEARAVLIADPTQSQDRIVLSQLAGLIDDYEGDYTLLAAQSGCDTPAALWAFMVNPYNLDEEARNQILQTLYLLPQPLRSHIAPRLSRRFLEVRETDAAERALQAANGSTVSEGHDAASTRAMIAESLDEPLIARSVLAEQASDNARTTPASVIRLIELGIETGMPVAEADLILASAMRQEHRDTPVASELALAEAAGRMQLGQYQAALDLLAGLEDEGAFLTLNTIYMELTQNSGAATFLGFAFSDEPDGLTASTQNAIATRLIKLGFPERATGFLSGAAGREDAAERRYLRAAAAIGTANYADAVDVVLGLTTPRANDLRARAYAGLGEHRAALETSAPDVPDPNLEFRAGAWERLSMDDDTVLSSFAQSVLEEPAVGPATSLADRRAILAQSQESRQAVENLLLRFDGTTIRE